MKTNRVVISTDEGLYRHIEVKTYELTAEELFYYYSGTYGEIGPNNPYRPRGGVIKVSQTIFKKVPEQN